MEEGGGGGGGVESRCGKFLVPGHIIVIAEIFWNSTHQKLHQLH